MFTIISDNYTLHIYKWTRYNLENALKNETILSSVAYPDPVFLGNPDPGKYRIRILYLQKTPVILIFLLYEIV